MWLRGSEAIWQMCTWKDIPGLEDSSNGSCATPISLRQMQVSQRVAYECGLVGGFSGCLACQKYNMSNGRFLLNSKGFLYRRHCKIVVCSCLFWKRFLGPANLKSRPRITRTSSLMCVRVLLDPYQQAIQLKTRSTPIALVDSLRYPWWPVEHCPGWLYRQPPRVLDV